MRATWLGLLLALAACGPAYAQAPRRSTASGHLASVGEIELGTYTSSDFSGARAVHQLAYTWASYVHLLRLDVVGTDLDRGDWSLPPWSPTGQPGPGVAVRLDAIEGGTAFSIAEVPLSLVVDRLVAQNAQWPEIADRILARSERVHAQLEERMTTGSAPMLDRGTPIRALSLGRGPRHTCAVLDGGVIACWGSALDGALGLPASGSVPPIARVVRGVRGAIAVAAATSFTCAVDGQGQVLCWGGRYGTEPAAIGIDDATAITAGSEHACVLHRDGRVTCWDARAPHPIGGIGQAIAISASTFDSCALRPDRKVACWDDRGWQASVVAGVDDAVAVAAGNFFQCALRSNGNVACWGMNDVGQLGRDCEGTRCGAGYVFGVHDAIAIGAGAHNACAVLLGGEVVCWGHAGSPLWGPRPSNQGGRVMPPTLVPGVADAIAIDVELATACAVLDGGEVDCWGRNLLGAVGDGTAITCPVPHRVRMR